MRNQFLNTQSDCDWLRSTHLKNVPHLPKFRSFNMLGNEDSPTRIILYRDRNPRFDAIALAVFVADSNGDLK